MTRASTKGLSIAIVVLLAACGGTSATTNSDSTEPPSQAPQTEEVRETPQATPEPTVEPTPAATPEPTPASSTFAVGEVVTITEGGDDWADFTVLEVQQAAEFADPDGFFNDTPQNDGYVFLAAKVRYEALVDGVDYNPFNFQIFVDGQAMDNVAFAINGPEPTLSSGTLPQGRTAEGWLLYEVPPVGKVLLSYTGNMFLDEAPIFEVVLREA